MERTWRALSKPDKTYILIKLVGVSEESVQQAIRNAIARVSQGLRGLEWFGVTEVRGLVRDDQVSQFQVKLKVGSEFSAKTSYVQRDASPRPGNWACR
jgi:dodecin